QGVRQSGPGQPALPGLYLPQARFARNAEAYGMGATLVVRSRLPVARVESALRGAVAPMRSQVSLGPLRSLDDYLDWYLRQRRFQSDLALVFAAAALGLTALGVYGVMAFSVLQRRRELAVRAALGAQRRQLSGLVLARGARLAVIGVSVGIVGALALSRFLASLLYGVSERDPITLVIVSVVLGFVALSASLLPALRAARLDPMTVLRAE